MEDAARAGDNARFFALARRTLQETLAVRWQMTPEQVTTEELDARLDRDEDGEEIRRLFALADEAEYAGQGLTGTDLSRWTHIVHRGTLERAP
jgi:hypothetical protein